MTIELSKTIEVSFSRCKLLIKSNIMHTEDGPIAAFLWGPPGIGKSTIIKNIAKELGYEVIDIRLSQIEATDLRGFPQIRDGKTYFCQPSFLPTENKKIIIFFDELNQASRLVQAAALQLILDRKLGDYVVPDSVIMVGAGNRHEDLCYVQPLSVALRTRMIHFEVVPDLDEWIAWAKSAQIDESIIGFIKFKPDLFCKILDGSFGSPNPRTWHFASRLIKKHTDVDIIREFVASAVGIAPAQEYVAFRQAYMSFNIEDILDGKMPNVLTEKVDGREDKNSSVKFAMTLAMAYAVTKNKERSKEANLNTFLNYIGEEYVTLFFKNITVEKSRELMKNTILKGHKEKMVGYLYGEK